jgi:hypothetical protein
MELNKIGHNRKVAKRAVLRVGKSRNIAKVDNESVGLPTKEKLDLGIGEPHAVEDNTGANT